ncbi:hypothetical protein [Flavobacterium anhuiense]|uniref:hypothetical protein n=1 Tax=Flavobacterium anhuiense TaxID=459526 RepID=UPI003D986515
MMNLKLFKPIVLIFIGITAFSCDRKDIEDQIFVRKGKSLIKEKSAIVPKSKTNPNEVDVKDYYLTYNAKSNGYIKLILTDLSVFEAKSVEGGSFSSMNLLLTQSNAVFDTLRRELVVRKINQ